MAAMICRSKATNLNPWSGVGVDDVAGALAVLDEVRCEVLDGAAGAVGGL